jgi:hypothetical protein
MSAVFAGRNYDDILWEPNETHKQAYTTWAKSRIRGRERGGEPTHNYNCAAQSLRNPRLSDKCVNFVAF